MKDVHSKLLHVCPRTGRVIGHRLARGKVVWLYPLIGLAALIWFLIRVIPKPSRASYPCQRVAAPLASSFVVWALGMAGSALAFQKARLHLSKAQIATAASCILVGMMGIGWAILGARGPTVEAYAPHPANQPIGEAKGLMPGRVVWVHDPSVIDWSGPNTGERWHEHIDAGVTESMLSRALQGYAGEDSDAAAWSAIFGHFNKGGSYTAGEKVFIKINLTTSNSGGRRACADEDYNQIICGTADFDSSANSPQLMHALLDQLVNVVGVAQSNIAIGDPTGIFVNYLFDPLYSDFPDVIYLDNWGYDSGDPGDPRLRTQTAFSEEPFCWSTDEDAEATEDRLPTVFAEATYVINLAVFKSHDLGGITVNAKNHYGSLFRTPIGILPPGVSLPTTNLCPDETAVDPPPLGPNNYYHFHNKLPGNNAEMTDMGNYQPRVDLMGHAHIGGKTILYLIDGIIGGKSWNSVPETWSLTPFNGDWPSSLFLTMDAVASESVAFDFISEQWPDHALMNEGVQDYLHEAALANSPPSGTCYDPEADGTCMDSLGVHEHWNSPDEKQYSRNLGTGDGIELVYLPTPNPCEGQTILFVAGQDPPEARDQSLVDHLTDAGYRVIVKADSDVETAHANGKDMVIISDSVDSVEVGTAFRDVTKPVLNWEPALFDEMGMTGPGWGVTHGEEADQTQIEMLNSLHPLARGLSGTVTATDVQRTFFWGVPSIDADLVASLAGGSARYALFSYDPGDTMSDMQAPGRRIGYFNGYGPDFTSDGWTLFDAAVEWGLGCGTATGYDLINGDTGEVLLPLNDGDVINIANAPTQNLNIQAHIDPACVGSVGFGLNGDPNYRTDNVYPYLLEDLASLARAPSAAQWTPGVGIHTLDATPFGGQDCTGRPGQSLTISFQIVNLPTTVDLAALTIRWTSSGTVLRWETSNEIGSLGFDILRAESIDGPRVQVNDALIPAQSPAGLTGAFYEFTDAGVQPGTTYYYWLKVISSAGESTIHGPVEVRTDTREGHPTFLPVVIKSE